MVIGSDDEAEGSSKRRVDHCSLSSSSSDSDRQPKKRRKHDKKDKKGRKKREKHRKKDKKKMKDKSHGDKKIVHNGSEPGSSKARDSVHAEPLFEFQRQRQLKARPILPSPTHAISPPPSRDHTSPSSSTRPEASESSRKRSMVPMSQAEAEKDKEKIERVFDPDTGRWRLVKGGGEIVEEIVSQQQQRAINKQATHWISRPGTQGF
jgi:hypothetical protein